MLVKLRHTELLPALFGCGATQQRYPAVIALAQANIAMLDS